MSREEVERKLHELKALYGGPPPKEIIDIEPERVVEAAAKDIDPDFNPNDYLDADEA
jgi:hypothetical protein